MAHIIIKNVGPIKKVELDLNKINVFMGPQSSGKSTIAKIISYCSWYEKNVILTSKLTKDFYKELLEFHNLEDNYFGESSYIEYKSNNCHIIFPGKDEEKLEVKVTVNIDNVFKNEKIEYIPAERNFVTIPGIGKYNESRNNVLSFLYDWFEAKREIIKEKTFIYPIKSLNQNAYYYNQEEDSDNVIIENGTEIKLRHASSGLMSVTPLVVVFDYILRTIYSKKRIKSPFEVINIQSKIDNYDETIKGRIKKLVDGIENLRSYLNKDLPLSFDEQDIDKMQNELNKALGFDSDYNYSKVIIEEPELNLFPDTQKDLIYYMLSVLNKEEREHQLVLTTHSPYVLFSLNNCMMGGLVKDKIPEDKRNEFESYHSWIDPKKVSIYEIHDGELKSIQDEDGIIEDNYLNKAYKENSAEYLSLLNYYDDEE
jgi:predicted ATP-dependent endonuclease of OLD family